MAAAVRQVAIVTTGGSDGAASAAALLLAWPEAAIWVTSKNHCHHTLAGLLTQEPLPGQVVVCGVGIGDNLAEVTGQLDALKAASVEVTWICGRGYLDDLQPELRQHCKTAFSEEGSNAGAVIKHFRLGKRKQAGLLRELGRQYADEERGDEEQSFFHDLLQAASDRYFQFGDLQPFQKGVRKLVGLEVITSVDREDVAFLRKAGPRKVTLGTSPAMSELRRQVGLVAPLEEPVLILGQSGTGKELVARSLHAGSPRRGGPFLPINCAVLGANEQLAADRLFGHAAGAFTGANKAAKGAFEAAAGGTLFLDELAELPLGVQTQLLRVLEDRTITPLGSQEERLVDVRLVAATNRELAEEVAAGRFRLDLYHRLNVLCLQVPPLTQRTKDLKALADPLLGELAARGHAYKLSKGDLEAARNYDWPGNVRQFLNLIRRAALMGTTLAAAIADERTRDLQARSGASGHGLGAREREALELFLPGEPEQVRPEAEVRRAYVHHALGVFDGNVSRAARALGMSVNTLRKWAL